MADDLKKESGKVFKMQSVYEEATTEKKNILTKLDETGQGRDVYFQQMKLD